MSDPTRRLRIAVYHNLPSGGAKRLVYEIVRRLAEAHVVDVFTLSSGDHEYCDLRPYVNEHFVFDFQPRRLYSSPMGRLNQLQRWQDLATLEKLGAGIARRINSGGYDVVFAHPCRHTLVPALLQYLTIPVVYFLHEPFGPATRRSIKRPYQQTKGIRHLIDKVDPLIRIYEQKLDHIRRRGLSRCDRLLANSMYTRDQIQLNYGVEAAVCYNGIDNSVFRPLASVGKEQRIISVGEMTPRKGFDFLIDSLALIPNERRPGLRIVSNWIDPNELAYLEGLAIMRRVKLDVLSHLNTDQLVLEYNKALLCAYSPVAEPLGLVPLEAMSCCTAVVGVAEAGVCETIQHGRTGLLVERDTQKFALAIMSLLDNKSLSDRLAMEGRKVIEREWTWEASLARIEDHLRECAEPKTRPAPR